MSDKREAARRAAAEKQARREAEARAKAAAAERAQEVIAYLRTLGIRPDDARRAAESCESHAEAPLDRRVRAAIAYYGSRIRPLGRTANRVAAAPAAGAT